MKSGKQVSKPQRSGFREIAIELIDRPDEIVRMDISDNAIKELAESIEEVGLLQPVIVHPKGERFVIIAGDRRYLAHEKLGRKKIMCSVRNIQAEDAIWLRGVENIQREDMTPFEEGHFYARMNQEKGFPLEEIAKRVSKSAGVVQRRLDILRMPDSFQKAVHEKKIGTGVAEELWSCPDAAKREYFLDLAVEHGITVAVARMWVDDFKKSLRSTGADVEGGRGPLSPYEDQPIFRACDLCRGPSEYKNLVELRVCQECGNLIKEAMKGKS